MRPESTASWVFPGVVALGLSTTMRLEMSKQAREEESQGSKEGRDLTSTQVAKGGAAARAPSTSRSSLSPEEESIITSTLPTALAQRNDRVFRLALYVKALHPC